jgi:hypothetical protein
MHTHQDGTTSCNCPQPLHPFPADGDEQTIIVHNTPHTHVSSDGTLVKCYHECKSQLGTLSFWVMTTLAFPIEHAIWTKMPGLSAIAKWAGL